MVEHKGDCKKNKISTLNKISYQSAKCSYRVIAWQIHQKIGMNPALGWNMERGIVRKPRFLQITSAPIKVQKSDYRVIAWQIKQKIRMSPALGWDIREILRKP